MLPEQNDTDLSDDDMIRRINEELVATWGNLVNRVLSLSDRNFDGTVPEPGPLTTTDEALVASIDKTLETAAGHIEAIELRAGLRAAMDAASEVNAYLNSEEPWHVLKEDEQRAGDHPVDRDPGDQRDQSGPLSLPALDLGAARRDARGRRRGDRLGTT